MRRVRLWDSVLLLAALSLAVAVWTAQVVAIPSDAEADPWKLHAIAITFRSPRGCWFAEVEEVMVYRRRDGRE